MDRRSVFGNTLKSTPPLLTITGKTLKMQGISASRSRKRLISPEFNRRAPTALKPSRLESTLSSFIASGISFISKKRTSTTLIENLSKTIFKKAIPKISIGDSFELENGSKIYKCMSNPNVNGNSNTLGLPIKGVTANNETFVIYKTPKFNPKRITNTYKFTRSKILVKKSNLIEMLQKSNGIQWKNEEEGTFKYFVGVGNNSELIAKTMKKRTRWKRVYSESSANFIWTSVKKNNIYDYLSSYNAMDQKLFKTSSGFPEILSDEHYCQIFPFNSLNPSKTRVYNRLSGNKELTSKKRLFFNMHSYYTSQNINPFTKIPLTFHVLYGSYDTTFKLFANKFKELKERGLSNIWIVKPGECTNRVNGINVCKTLEQVVNAVNFYESESERTHIIQKYIENPLLYKGRKFDIRCYSVITSFQGNIQCYFYKEGYLRTSSAEYSVNNVENRYVHLTNDAVQKYSSNYGKHEAGNKLSYAEFQEYLNKNHEGVDFYKIILPQIRDMVRDSVMATYFKLDHERKLHSFEILGYDFLIDSNFKVWLIEANTNPCLELSSPYLEMLIPKMIDEAFAITIDQLFPNGVFANSDFELVFNENMIKYQNDKENETEIHGETEVDGGKENEAEECICHELQNEIETGTETEIKPEIDNEVEDEMENMN